jgi:hypothetical protein
MRHTAVAQVLAHGQARLAAADDEDLYFLDSHLCAPICAAFRSLSGSAASLGDRLDQEKDEILQSRRCAENGV